MIFVNDAVKRILRCLLDLDFKNPKPYFSIKQKIFGDFKYFGGFNVMNVSLITNIFWTYSVNVDKLG